MPCVTGPKKGRSYYSGDGLNEALVDVDSYLAMLNRARTPTAHQLIAAKKPAVATAPTTTVTEIRPKPRPANLFAAIIALFKGAA